MWLSGNLVAWMCKSFPISRLNFLLSLLNENNNDTMEKGMFIVGIRN